MERKQKQKGFKAYLRSRLPISWETALKEQKVYGKFIDLIYASVAKRYTTKEARFIKFREITRNLEISDPTKLLETCGYQYYCLHIKYNALIDRINALNYQCR